MIVGKLHEPVASEAMSQPRCSMPPRSEPLPERPPVENCTIMPGQAFRNPASKAAKRSGSEVGVWSPVRTWTWAMVAPASNAAWVEFHLFTDGNRNRRIMLFARHRTGDGDSDDARRCRH